eukprot:TRINITY_DN37654_c0_g3_i1.p1 TRINITY_DN37654_c0_g3~~TRINITY_DN37654_c0_g3_i1.p1  ORF type:complete len:409 (-),score=75.33 TRINITY_DN37654_c0_g3_i1:233-1459(-)
MQSIPVKQIRIIKKSQLFPKNNFQRTRLIHRLCDNTDKNQPSTPELITSTKKRRSDRISYDDDGSESQVDIVRDATTTQRATPKPNQVVDAEYTEKIDVDDDNENKEIIDSDIDVEQLEKDLEIEDEEDKEMFRKVVNMDNDQVEFLNTLSVEDIDILEEQLRDEKLVERSEKILVDIMSSGPRTEERIAMYDKKGEIKAVVLAILFKRIQAAEMMQEDGEIIDALLGLFRRLRAVFERNRSSAALRLLDDLFTISDENSRDAMASREAVKSRMQAAFSGLQGNMGIMEIAQKLSEQLPEDARNQQKIEDFLPQTEFVPKEQFIQEVEQLVDQAEIGKETMEEQYAEISSQLQEFDKLSKTEGFQISDEERSARQNLKNAERELEVQLDYRKAALLQVQQILSIAKQL